MSILCNLIYLIYIYCYFLIVQVCDLPVRAAKFVPRKNWVVTGSDDYQIRIFNYNTLERIHNFEAHSDYVRCIIIHPTQPYILTSSGKLFFILKNKTVKYEYFYESKINV